MLSVLIPLFNLDIVVLATKLHQQLSVENIPFEIIICDDCSSNTLLQSKNQQLNLSNLRYIVNSENLGRALTREKLVHLASYNHILFLDADSDVYPDFIANYKDYLEKHILVYGGITTDPKDLTPKNTLRYYYSKHREEIASSERSKSPYITIKLCNLLMPKSWFKQQEFGLNLKEYGHEDTLFVMMLEQQKCAILHIQNPIIHTGIEENAIFIEKTKQAVLNLFHMQKQFKSIEQIRLLNTNNKLKKHRLDGLVFVVLNFFNKYIERRLWDAKPNLVWYDLFKLHYLLSLELGIYRK